MTTMLGRAAASARAGSATQLSTTVVRPHNATRIRSARVATAVTVILTSHKSAGATARTRGIARAKRFQYDQNDGENEAAAPFFRQRESVAAKACRRSYSPYRTKP